MRIRHGYAHLREGSNLRRDRPIEEVELNYRLIQKNGAWRVIADRDVRAVVAQRIVTSGGSLTQLADLQPSLEEVYTHYFQAEARNAA